MFNFITRMFKKKEKPLSVLVAEIPEQVKNDSQIIDPSKSHVIKDVGELPETVIEGEIKKTAGHVNFNKTKSITRKFKAAKIREELAKRKSNKTSYYDDDGITYLG